MAKLTAFTNMTLDGYFTGQNGDLSWAHTRANKEDKEWNDFVANNAKGGGILLLGRVTYDMMASYWPTPAAKQNDPETADGINKLQKVVFSRTLKTASWSNTRIVKDDMVAEVRKMKSEGNPGITILGSGSIVSQLTQTGLIDEYNIVINPIVIGKGRTLFEAIDKQFALKLTKSRPFKNGNVLLSYEPAA